MHNSLSFILNLDALRLDLAAADGGELSLESIYLIESLELKHPGTELIDAVREVSIKSETHRSLLTSFWDDTFEDIIEAGEGHRFVILGGLTAYYGDQPLPSPEQLRV